MQNNSGLIVIFNSLMFIAILSAILFGITNVIVSRYSSSRSFAMSKQSYLAAQSGIGEVYYRLKSNMPVPASLNIQLSSASASINTSDIPAGKSINVDSAAGEYERNVLMNLSLGTGISFHYGIQSGNGGFYMENSSKVYGNIFSTGIITGTGNYVYGDVISAGPAGLISSIHATGTAFAHTIQNSTVDKDAYYMDLINTSVVGTKYPNSPDQSPVSLPISDAQIDEWKQQAMDAGDVVCTDGTYKIDTDTPLGPKRIPCDLEISGNPTVTIGGYIWVVGNIVTKNSPIIKMSSALANKNIALIADDPSDRVDGSRIIIANSTVFQGSGSPGSFVFLISQNHSAEEGGSTEAISLGNSSAAMVAYASHGLISLQNNMSLKEVTAYKITLRNSASVTYDTGLASALFEAGPGGGYDLLDWLEI